MVRAASMRVTSGVTHTTSGVMAWNTCMAASSLVGPQIGRRPWMILMSTTAIARIRSRWMKPPKVYELTIPRSHMITRITKMVHSMASSAWLDEASRHAAPMSAARTACNPRAARIHATEAEEEGIGASPAADSRNCLGVGAVVATEGGCATGARRMLLMPTGEGF
jgi:hypothetical protein